MKNKDLITKLKVKYPKNFEPDFVNPLQYTNYRFAIGKTGNNPLFCIGMNPSAAREEYSDRTVNKVITNAINNKYDGWVMLNIYPIRATEAKNLDNDINHELHNKNIESIIELINKFNVNEIWCAWGDIDDKKHYLSQVKNDIIDNLKKINVKCFYFGELTKKYNNPKHPLYLKIEWEKKKYF